MLAIARRMGAERSGVVAGPAGPISWRSAGSGPPLVLVNGYAATAADWDPSFLAALGRFATVVCFDNRGVGDSRGDLGSLSVGAMAADAEALLDGLRIGSAALAGWSLGGFVAQQLAASAPERVERLILLSTSAGGPAAPTSGPAVWGLLTDSSGTPDEQAKRLIGLLFPAPVAERIYAEFGSVVAAARAALDPAALAAQERAMSDWFSKPAEERLAAIAAPALVATGTEDAVIPPASSKLLADSLTDSWLARFPGGGHAFMAQEPERLAALVGAFLRP